ncbi:RNA polymerase sigma factor [Catenuloplanes sp. NPDC020197]|uniref:RNA polymerase sigma-70 factor (ECF subfamily) n=1 Tax=Catenuloplanes niger TaxID=587534 RepID=A0AAE4A2F9_9ACTN|nr:sigma-70 family RNA polymerase sigma factor [Catenuloplanes niger]MDR7327990.1 RNA polymerase sigma-70 factor (ECF subfamily) [Catenuloplanes niger]
MNPSTPDPAGAFRELFRDTYDDLLLFVERRTHPAVAEDVVADVFLVAWRRFADVPVPRDEARAWLFTVAYHTMRNSRRSDHRQQSLALRILREPDTVARTESDRVAARLDLVQAWRHLSPDDQQVLTLTVFEDLTGSQAAKVLGITRATFSVRLMRARRRLRRHLDQAGPIPTPSTAPNAAAGRVAETGASA